MLTSNHFARNNRDDRFYAVCWIQIQCYMFWLLFQILLLKTNAVFVFLNPMNKSQPFISFHRVEKFCCDNRELTPVLFITNLNSTESFSAHTEIFELILDTSF